MQQALLVFLGGGLGSVARYGLGVWIRQNVFLNFPVATLLANILASLMLGYLVGRNLGMASTGWLLLAVGFCGGFSTFSTFSNEAFQLLIQHDYVKACGVILANVGACLLATAMGFALGK